MKLLNNRVIQGTLILILTLGLTLSSVAQIFAKELNSSNFKIIDPTIGTSGGTNEGSGSYDLLSSIGGASSDSRLTSASYAFGSGFPNGIQANVPIIRCLEAITSSGDTICTNFPLGDGAQGECGGLCVDRAKIEVDPQNNPIDSLYLVSVYDLDSSTQYYLQSDHTIDTTYDINDYMTLCDLQGIDTRTGSGCEVFGDPDWDPALQSMNIFTLVEYTTYEVKVRALNGDFTEGVYSPALTVTPGGLAAITLDIDIAPSTGNTTETSAPYSVALGTLSSNVVTGVNRIWVDLDSTFNPGISLYVRNTGLTNGIDTIVSEAEDLSADNNNNGGYGFKIESFTQSSEGPLVASSNYSTGTADTIGSLTTSNKKILSTNTTGLNVGLLTGGRASIMVKSKAASNLSGGLYNDLTTFTLVANL